MGSKSDGKKYVLSSTVQELGRLCHYNKKNDLRNVPYTLVPKSLLDFLKNNTTRKEEGGRSALMYSSFMGTQSIDRYTHIEIAQAQNDTIMRMGPKDTSFDATSDKTTNMILLDAEPQCGKTGTYCCLIAELRKLICKEISFDSIDYDEDNDDGEDREEEEIPSEG